MRLLDEGEVPELPGVPLGLPVLDEVHEQERRDEGLLLVVRDAPELDDRGPPEDVLEGDGGDRVEERPLPAEGHAPYPGLEGGLDVHRDLGLVAQPPGHPLRGARKSSKEMGLPLVLLRTSHPQPL